MRSDDSSGHRPPAGRPSAATAPTGAAPPPAALRWPAMPVLRRFAVVLLVLAAVVALPACGRDEGDLAVTPTVGVKGDEEKAAEDLGFPIVATKNTTRIGGADSVANAAAAARAVYTGATRVNRPRAVVVADQRDWRVGLAAAVLMGPPLRAPLLYSDGDDLPPASRDALAALQPLGAKEIGGAQVIRVGATPKAEGRTTDIRGENPIALARSIDAFQSAARKTTSDHVLVVSADSPAFAMPAAAWAAKSGDPILFVHRDSVPRDTREALAAHQQPKIYVLGPASVISKKVTDELRRLGTVQRIEGQTPEENAIAFARFTDGSFGWGIVDPGHGLVFAGTRHPTDAAAAAPLSASGTYGPLLLIQSPERLSQPLRDFLLDIQPGYTRDPVRGVYNRAWIIGDEQTMSVATQSTLDALLEIIPVNESGSTQPR